jgi:hypothetical protein
MCGRMRMAIAVVLACACGSPASAQYFGQNKVIYHRLKFEVMQTDHFDVYHYPAERKGAEIAARLAERWHARLERLFTHRLAGRQPLILYASHADFEQTNVVSGTLTESTGGVTESLRRRIVLPLGGAIADTDHVIGHELVHAFQFDITARADMGPGEAGASQLPLWFIEGMAEYLSVGPVDVNTAMWLRAALVHDALPTIKKLDDTKYFPYRWGQAFWAYVCGRWGDQVIRPMLDAGSRTGNVDMAIESVLHVTAAELSRDWQESIRKTYRAALETARPPLGRRLIEGRELVADLNVGPTLSPDGKHIGFISQRGLFAADLYIADVETGRIVRKLTSTATDPHYSSIQFIYSAAAWAPDSRRVALATVTKGDPTLAIFDAVNGRKERDIRVSGVDDITSPSWAPDGSAIAFSGMKQGLTDLFVYDLKSGAVRQLTDDAYADLQPVWSPDGERLAFATDRFSTDLNSLTTGPYQLAIYDLRSSEIAKVPAFEATTHLTPQWAPDAESLYFVADRGGIANIYRVWIATGGITQLTAVATGVSGITTGSPALSVASRTGHVAFSVHQDDKYDIYVAEPAAARGELPTEYARTMSLLPPADRGLGEVADLLADTSYGLSHESYETVPYKAKLSLEQAGQTMVGAGVGRFGPALSGGLSLTFGDELGNHTLGTAVGLNSGVNGMSWNDIGGEVVYIDRQRRWNWGVIGAQIPYLTSGYRSTTWITPGGDLVQTDELLTLRQTERSASGITVYPFDRSRRIELQAGATRISYDQTIDTQSYSLLTGLVYEENSITTPVASPLTLGTAAAAYVFDSSNWGATSPVQGQRYRLEVSPVVGSLRFTGALADYRRYFMPVPFYTIAARVVHYGRYGPDGEDARLYPLDISSPAFMRGYDSASIDASECIATASSGCPAYERLLGSRMLVGNVELRFPLLRPLGLTRNMYGPVPIEVAVFAASGVAWTRNDRPRWFGGSRAPISSTGVSLRVNIFGAAVGRFDFARPFQRPGQGWTFSFNLLPGW